jgi:predicted transcriptional regulator/ubiquinone/menaquinone biosynthesis C-methylase UbiE
MSTKRLKDQINAEILIACRGEGKTKTNIVYASGLNFRTILSYLISLSKNGLIEIIPGKYPIYKITPKGEDALSHLNALEELMPKYVTEEVMDLQSNGNAVSADTQNLELSQNGKNLVYVSPLENETFNKISPIYSKIQEMSANEAKSRSLDYLKFKLMDLVEYQEQVNWLEIGCGDGDSLEVLDGIRDINKIHYHGIDFTGDYLDKVEKRAEKCGIKYNIERRSPHEAIAKNEYDIETAISIFHSMDPFHLPVVLKNMVEALKDNGLMVISDFEEPIDYRKNIVNWDAGEIARILKGIYGDIRFNYEYIPSTTYPNELRYYRGLIRKPNLDGNRFDDFTSNYRSCMKKKRDKSSKKLVILKNQLKERAAQILQVQNIEAKKLSDKDLAEIRDTIEDEYSIKALKIQLLSREVLWIDNSLKKFEK